MLFFHHLACIWSALQILLSIYKSSLMNTVFISWILDIHLNELSRTIAAIFFIHIFQFKDETKKIFLFLVSWSISFLSFCYKGFFIGYFRVQIFELHLRFRSIFFESNGMKLISSVWWTIENSFRQFVIHSFSFYCLFNSWVHFFMYFFGQFEVCVFAAMILFCFQYFTCNNDAVHFFFFLLHLIWMGNITFYGFVWFIVSILIGLFWMVLLDIGIGHE